MSIFTLSAGRNAYSNALSVAISYPRKFQRRGILDLLECIYLEMTDGIISLPHLIFNISELKSTDRGGFVWVFFNCSFHRCHFLMVVNNQIWYASRWNSWPSGTMSSCTILATDSHTTVLQPDFISYFKDPCCENARFLETSFYFSRLWQDCHG